MSAATRWLPGLMIAAMAMQLHATTSFLILPLLACAGLLQGGLQPTLYDRRLDRLEWSIIVWLLCWLLSAILALHVHHAFALSTPMLVFALMFAVLYRAEEERLHNAISFALAVLATVQALSVLAVAIQPGEPQQWIQRVDSPWLLVPNDAVWMLCLWPLWWSQARRLARHLQWACMIALSLQGIALLVLQSRLAVLVLMGLLLLAGCQRGLEKRAISTAPKRQHRQVLALLASIGLLAVAAAIWFGKGIGSLQARWQLWQAAWDLWLAHPWLGIGPHGFGMEYRAVVEGPLVDARHTPWPHQLGLELLANTGVIGFAAFLRVCLAVVPKKFEGRAEGGFALGPRTASLLVFAVVSLLEASTLRLWWWVLLAFLLVGQKTKYESNTDQS